MRLYSGNTTDMERASFVLQPDPHPARQNAVRAVLAAPVGHLVQIKPATRSGEQNSWLHAILSDVAAQCEWAGRKWDIESWKRLMTAAWCRTRNEGIELVPAIDGAGFDVLYRRTSKLSKAECSELCEYILAWGAEKNVQWSEPQRAKEPA